jgi:hypothetical protein
MKNIIVFILSALIFTQYAYADTATVSLAGNTATTGDGFFLNLPVTYSCDVTPGISDPNFTSVTSSLSVVLLQKQNLPKKQFRVAAANGFLPTLAICDGQPHTENIVLTTQCCTTPYQKGLADASISLSVSVLEAIIDFCPPFGCIGPQYRTINAPPTAGSVNVSIVRK